MPEKFSIFICMATLFIYKQLVLKGKLYHHSEKRYEVCLCMHMYKCTVKCTYTFRLRCLHADIKCTLFRQPQQG